MREIEVRFQMFGSAFIEADSAENARKAVATELIEWSGFGTDIDSIDIDGVDTEVDS